MHLAGGPLEKQSQTSLNDLTKLTFWALLGEVTQVAERLAYIQLRISKRKEITSYAHHPKTISAFQPKAHSKTKAPALL